MGKHSPDKERYMSTVKVGPKGQIVIPKEVRDMFGIQPGASLILLADKKRGIALQHLSVFSKIADAIFGGKGKEIYPEHTEADSHNFAQAIKEIEQETGEEEAP